MRLLRLLTTCLAVALAGCSPADTGTPATAPIPGSTPYSLLQMNLCLSGLAPCLNHPDAVDEAIAVIGEHRPDAVTLNEVCSRDVARIAEDTGYHRRFVAVPYAGGTLTCQFPGGRGVFGIAVLTAAEITGRDQGLFRAQSIDPEHRGWLCVTTAERMAVCTTHLAAASEVRTAVLRQCAELTVLLAEWARRGPTLAAGDMNTLGSCAPADMWTHTDVDAAQRPGVQHAYGTSGLRPVTSQSLPATYTDHDFLYVEARRVP